MLRKLSQVVVGALCVLALADTAAFAKKQVYEFIYFFPGADDFGFLDDNLGNDGVVKETYRPKRQKIVLIGRAAVQNLSGVDQDYPDTGLLTGYGKVIADDLFIRDDGLAAYFGLVRQAPFPF